MTISTTILQNRYRIIRQLGEGGMGKVYEALDQRVSSIVAVKETLTGSVEGRRAFEREAQMLANLRHSALPKVMDYFSEGESDYLVMEFIPGYDLAEMLELRGSPFPQAKVLRWADDLLKVLEHLHGQKPPVLHRDIKPSNLKLTKQGEIFLLDFGLAKGSAGQMPTLLTSRSVHGYTPVYAPLEQIHRGGTDPRSDLYSLGATLYHLSTGVTPVDAPTRFNAIEEEQPDPLKPIEQLNPQFSANIAAVIHQAMAISRRQRPASAAEMRRALKHAAEEDEQRAGEEEYARAEANRKQREEEQKRTQEEAARLAEEERQRREAEMRKQEEARLREAEQRRLEEETTRRAEEEAGPRQANIPRTVSAPTLRAPEDLSQTLEAKVQPDIKTIQALPPQISVSDNRGGSASDGPPAAESASANHTGGRRTMIIAGGILALVIVAVLVASLARNGGSQNTNQSQSSSETPVLPHLQPQPDSKASAPAIPAGMVYVPGGTFTMGRNDGDEAERPAHQVTVKPLLIDTYEVTNDDYAKFIQATGRNAPTRWTGGQYPAGAGQKPITGVAWDDANDYCLWAGGRLPSEDEWEFAARGTDNRLYPWGSNWQQGNANANKANQGLVDVGSFKSTSPIGAFDMVGNAWEWTASDFRAYPGGRLPANLPSGELKVIRGGSYESLKDYATTTYRTGWPARGAKTYDQTGFRCVKDITQ